MFLEHLYVARKDEATLGTDLTVSVLIFGGTCLTRVSKLSRYILCRILYFRAIAFLQIHWVSPREPQIHKKGWPFLEGLTSVEDHVVHHGCPI